MVKKSKTLGGRNHRQKNVSNKLIRQIESYRKSLQLQENIKFGRKARAITFVFASNNAFGLARHILGGKK